MDQLVIIALYSSSNEITDAVFQAIADSACQQVDTRLFSAGKNNTTLFLTLEGSWNQLIRFKTRFSIIQERHHVKAIMKESSPLTYSPETAPYQAYITAGNASQLLPRLIQLFLGLPLRIHECLSNTYTAPLTKVSILEIHLLFVTLPEHPLQEYREHILQFCDENNCEILLELKRN